MNRKLRVLHILPDFGSGGAERLVVDLLAATDKTRFDAAAVSLYSENGTILDKEIKARGLKVYYLNKRLGLDIRILFRIYRLFRDFGPDIVHTHLSVLRYVLLPMIICRIDVRIHTIHNVAQKEADRVGKIINSIAFHIGGVLPVSLSREVANTVREVYGRRLSTPVIFNGISTARFMSESSKDASANEKARDFTLLHVGRMAPQKNHLLLIEAFALAVKEYPSMQLFLVGDGPLKEQAEKIATKLELTKKVYFLGLRNDVPDLLEKSDVFILSSDWEGMPLTVLEAMAAGKAVLATAVGAVPEIVQDGVTGILVPPRDVQSLAKGILRLADDSVMLDKMGRTGRQRAVEWFDISRTAGEYEALYLRLLRC